MKREKILKEAYSSSYQRCFSKAWNYWTEYAMSTWWQRKRMKMPEFFCEDCESYSIQYKPCMLRQIATERKRKRV